MRRASAHLLGDGRLHLSHGPIDVIVSASGAGETVERAFLAAERRFAGLLEELVEELPTLRRPLAADRPLSGSVARRMARAVAPFRGTFVTPMAAVAGAVADELCEAITAAAPLSRVIVNNGGDIAFHLAPGESASARMVGLDGTLLGRARLAAGDGVGGIATSGRGGRSLSLGIADSVTVLGRSAAAADAAATLIANAVDLPGHPAIRRAPAHSLDPDSDLGARLVTLAVGPLEAAEVSGALDRGVRRAAAFHTAGLIVGAALSLAGESVAMGGAAQRLEAAA